MLLKVENLRLYFRTSNGIVQAVDNVSFELAHDSSVVIVGESGCGKSSLAKAILRLLPRNVSTYTGRVYLDNVDIMQFSDEQFRQKVRWMQMSYVSQGAMNSLNPVVKVGNQVSEPLFIHSQKISKKEVLNRVQEALQLAGVPLDFMGRYPFELSGGMRQRTVIAMALVTKPKLIVMDEPTSALDVLTQANILNALKRIQKELRISYILITHDIATSSELAENAIVMYAGQAVEMGTAGDFYLNPLHPYAQKLMASVPTLREDKKLEFIPGQPPSLISPPEGCRFAERCEHRFDACSTEPEIKEVQGRKIKCHLY